MTYPTRFRWTSASRTHVGLVRKLNEDSCLDLSERGIWAVADGMGGHSLGDLASRMVVQALERLPAPGSIGEFMVTARESMQAVNRQLREETVVRDVQIIGSTVVILLAYHRHCGYLWAGDSGIYLFRNGRLTQLTRDHSRIEELISSGSLTAEEAMDLTAYNMITRAVGAAELLDLDEETLEVNDGDMFLLCSDGLSNGVSEEEIIGALIPGNCRQAAETLVDLALKYGGRDNVSAVVVRAEDLYSDDKTALNPAL